MTQEKILAAKTLVQMHKRSEPDLIKAFLLASPGDDEEESPIKLLEIVKGATEAGVVPIFFRADKARSIPYSSILIELSPDEFRNIGSESISVDKEHWKIVEELATDAE